MVTRKFTISRGSRLSTFLTYRKRTKQENGEIEMRETKKQKNELRKKNCYEETFPYIVRETE